MRSAAAAKAPKAAAAAVAATEPTSPAPVAEQRVALAKRREEQIERRVREYADTMNVMKARGARAPTPAPGGRKRAKAAPKRAAAAKGTEGPVEPEGPAAAGFAPLQILAEGDSWFDYPVPLFGGGIIPRLEPVSRHVSACLS